VAGATASANPDYDLPADFAARRAACYENLGLPTNPRAFKDRLKTIPRMDTERQRPPHYYIRQLRDAKISAVVEGFDLGLMQIYAGLCA